MGRLERRRDVRDSAKSDEAFSSFMAGDLSSVGPLLEHSRPALERYVGRSMKSSWIRHYYCSRDIVQATYVKVLRKLSSFHGESRGQWEQWLRRISRRELLDTVRAQRKLQGGVDGPDCEAASWELLELSGSSSSACTKAAREESQRVLRQVLTLFSQRDQQIVVLRNFEEMPWEMVAEEVGCSPSAARMRYIRNIRPRLMEMLRAFGGGQESDAA